MMAMQRSSRSRRFLNCFLCSCPSFVVGLHLGEMGFKMGKNIFVLMLTLALLFGGVYSVSATSTPARIVNGFLSNAFVLLRKWVMSLKTTTKTALSGRPIMKFEGGYIVQTVFDGSKLGIEPYTIEVLPDGDLLILDSTNCNLYKISSALSVYSRPKLVTGSPDGYCGHVDGKLRDGRMNHPKGLTVDDRGNIYVADTENMAIRKISDTGVTTIAGGKRGRGVGHVDGPSEDAKLSNDFDLVYLGSSCSLLVIDRGNKAVREIQLHFDDCAYQYGSSFPLGIAVLLAAGFFGYMLALLQHRIGLIVSSQKDEETMEPSVSLSQYQKPLKPSARPPLIPTEYEQEKQEENFLGSLGRLAVQTMESAADILRGFLPMSRKKHSSVQYHSRHKYSNSWPVQESFVIPDEDEPPSIEARTPTPKKTYAFMTKDSEKMQQQLRQSRAFFSGWDGENQKQHTTKKRQQHQYQHQYVSSTPQTHYEHSSDNTEEIVFGEVQEQDKLKVNVVIKPLDHGMMYGHNSKVHSRFSYMDGG